MERAQILTICNDPDMQDAFLKSLSLHIVGSQLDSARTRREALELVARQDYDVIVCDGRMSGKNCLEVLRAIKHLRPWTPIILIGSRENAKLTSKVFKAGAYDFLYKPLDRQLFGFSVQRALEASHMRKGNDEKVSKDRMLRIEGIDPSWTVSQLKDVFARFGRIVWARLVINSNGEAVARGYVEMATLTEARNARRALDGALVRESRLAVMPTFASA